VDGAELVEVTSEAELRELIPEPVERAANKARPRLHELDRHWLAGDLPSRARIAQTLESPDESMENLERYYGPEYAKKLYA
jgi:hypothetical protein